MKEFLINRRTIVKGAAALVGAQFIARRATAQEQWEQVVEAAKQEGLVNFYSVAAPDQNDSLVAAFNKVYPEINVVTTRGVAELIARIEAEKETGTDGGDVLCYADPVYFVNNAENLLALDSPAAAAFPEGGWYVPNKAAATSYSPLGFLVWNTDFVSEELANWEDILKPEFSGRVGTREGMTATLAGYIEFLHTELGVDYLDALGKQQPRFYSSSVPLTQAIASGEVWVANSGNIPTIHQLLAEGAPIGYSFPQPSFANPQIAGALAHSKRPNAARVFMDFSLSPEGQKAINDRDRSASAIAGLEGTIDLSRFQILDPAKYTPEVRAQWNTVFERYLRQSQ